MIVMTEGLRELAGDVIRNTLVRFTRSPATGAITGAATTAILQSSSATTVAAVGFVGAGLLTFPQALGIIFGANIGTTVTGWLVAILGFKLHLGTFVLPIILAGAVLRLFGKGRASTIGYAVAGFGLIFVGITFMQQGMDGLSQLITPETLPSDTFLGRIQLVMLGIMITVITQSSSAGIAASLTALYAGAISFEQAAALVIGMNIGTTITALIATIGGSVGSRRTGASHVAYNFLIGIGALLLITPFTLLWETLFPSQLALNAGIALVAFHTTFNTLGVMIVLPFTGQFARLVERMIPDKALPYTNTLDKALLLQPGLALNMIQNSIHAEMLALFNHLNAILGKIPLYQRANLPELKMALDQTQDYTDHINLSDAAGTDWERLIAIIHTLDHMQRLLERCEEQEDRAIVACRTEKLREICQLLTTSISEIMAHINNNRWTQAARHAKQTAETIGKQIHPLRDIIMASIASGEIDAQTGTSCLEAIRWLQRVSKHVARINGHFSDAVLAAGK